MFDLHIDFILQQRLFRYDGLKRHNAWLYGQPRFWHADIPRLLEANFQGVCLGIHYWPISCEAAWKEMHKQFDYLDLISARHASCLRVRAHSDWQRAIDQNLLALAPGVEGAHMLHGKLERVEQLAKRQAAYLTLTHFSKNEAATPSMGLGANETDGLTTFGRELVQELERHDVLVDVAHVNTQGVLDTCAIATKPLMCTHTGVKGVHQHARNLSDEELDAVAETQGIVGIMYAPCYMSPDKNATSECVLDHIAYTVERIGIDHVALGSDYDGWLPSIPKDMRDCTDAHLIIDGLKRRGFSQSAIEKIRFANALRLLSRNTI